MKKEKTKAPKRNAKQNNRHAIGLGNGKFGKKMKRIERAEARSK